MKRAHICWSAAFTFADGRVAEAIDAFEDRDVERETADAHAALAEAYLAAKDLSGRP